MRTILAAVALVASLLCTSCEGKPPFAQFEKYTGRLDLPDGGVCSATRFRRALLTTRHCLEGPSRQVRFQGILVNVKRVWIDGENIWVYTDRDWGPGPKIGKANKGDALYLIGNAGGFDQIAREGVVAAYTDKAPPKRRRAMLLSMNAYHGDSGAGLFNRKGELVAVFLGMYAQHTQESSGEYTFWTLGIAVPVL